jgi:hypothetical protein
MYIAKKRIKKPDGGYYQPGDPIPEAANWRHARNWVESGHLELAAGPAAEAKPVVETPSETPVEEPTEEIVTGYPCEECGKELATEVGLKRHKARVHGE